jgi:hypothetical protein
LQKTLTLIKAFLAFWYDDYCFVCLAHAFNNTEMYASRIPYISTCFNLALSLSLFSLFSFFLIKNEKVGMKSRSSHYVKGFKINKNNDNKEEKKDREREEDDDRDDVDDFFTLKESMVELNELCKTAGFRTVGYLTQILQQKNPRTCIGSGKVYEK